VKVSPNHGYIRVLTISSANASKNASNRLIIMIFSYRCAGLRETKLCHAPHFIMIQKVHWTEPLLTWFYAYTHKHEEVITSKDSFLSSDDKNSRFSEILMTLCIKNGHCTKKLVLKVYKVHVFHVILCAEKHKITFICPALMVLLESWSKTWTVKIKWN